MPLPQSVVHPHPHPVDPNAYRITPPNLCQGKKKQNPMRRRPSGSDLEEAILKEVFAWRFRRDGKGGVHLFEGFLQLGCLFIMLK
jgi:hypothetical protein